MRIYIISSGGNDSYGNMSVSETDVLLCVYDVRKPGTVRFLRDMVCTRVTAGFWSVLDFTQRGKTA